VQPVKVFLLARPHSALNSECFHPPPAQYKIDKYGDRGREERLFSGVHYVNEPMVFSFSATVESVKVLCFGVVFNPAGVRVAEIQGRFDPH